MKCSKRQNHIDDIWTRHSTRTSESLNKYCTKIVIDDIEKMNSDEIKEQVLEMIKESNKINYTRSVCSLSETYSYGQIGLDSNRKIIIDKTRDRNEEDNSNGYGDFTRNIHSTNLDLDKNNEELLFESHDRTEEENRLIEVLEKMTNTKYTNLYKKHYNKNKYIKQNGVEVVDEKKLYKSIESELN